MRTSLVAGALFLFAAGLIYLLTCGSDSARRHEEAPADVTRGHGHQQLTSMLRDRPSMALFVKEGDLLWQWASDRFEGAGTGFLVYWRDDAPRTDGSVRSDCMWPVDGAPAFIRVRDDAPATNARWFEDQWARAVYELLNLERWRAYSDAWERAFAGDLGRAEWIEAWSRCEHATALRRAAYYREVLVPWAKKAGFKTHPGRWSVHSPASFEEWTRQYTDRGVHPFPSLGDYYDDAVEPYLAAAAHADK